MECSDWIALGGVIVTGIFSLLVWRATVKTVDLAEATFELNRELSFKEEERVKNYKRIMRRQLVPYILKESQKVHDSVVDTDERSIHRKLTNDAPKSLNVNMNELAEFFNDDEAEIINRAWETYDSYLMKYYQTGYQGNGMKVLLEHSPTVIITFHELIETLKKIKFV